MGLVVAAKPHQAEEARCLGLQLPGQLRWVLGYLTNTM